MASRQFGFILFRALAVYFFYNSLSQFHLLFNIYFGQMELMGSKSLNGQKITSLAVWVIQFIIAVVLWTNAEKFSGSESDAKATVRGGNWVVRLVFTALGILLCTYLITNIVSEIGYLVSPDMLRQQRSRDTIVYAVTEGLRFLLGLYLVLAYKFDKAAAFEAAQTVEPPLED